MANTMFTCIVHVARTRGQAGARAWNKQPQPDGTRTQDKDQDELRPVRCTHLSGVTLQLPHEKARRLPIPALGGHERWPRSVYSDSMYISSSTSTRVSEERGVTGERTNQNHSGRET